MKKSLRSLLALLALGTASEASAQTFIAGITAADQLVIVNAANPAVPLSPVVPITGIAAGQTIAGADFRPRTGELFILGYNASNGEARLYVVSQSTGAATAVGTAAITLPLGTGAVGFDFNPTVDLIRVIAANRANYRLSPITGAVSALDGTLTYAATDVNMAATPNIGAGAYTNSYVASEVTTLYDYDASLNVLVSQVPPNAGTLNTIGSTGITVGTTASIDMDIAYDAVTSQNTAYLSVGPIAAGLFSSLYTLNLTTGAASFVGAIGSNLDIKDISVAISRNVPDTVTGQLVYGLTRNNRNLITFDSDQPGIIRKFMPVTGVVTGQRIVGMDVRPVDRKLYAMGYDEATNGYSLYTIDTGSGAATAINTAPGTIALGGVGARIGFDFNPTVDRIRVSSSNTANFRLNPNDGAIAATDGNFKFINSDVNAGRTARVGAVAYTRSFAGTTSTMLYALDDSLGALLLVDTPNSGASRTFLPNAFMPNAADATTDIDFYYDSTAAVDRGFLALNTGGSSNDSLWSFTPSALPAAITPIGRIGQGVQVMDIAVQLKYTGTLSLRDLSLLPGINIYPNPAGETLYIRTSGSGTVRVVVSDLMGRPVMSTTDVLGKVINLNVGALPAGLYNLMLESNGQVVGAAKVVKQ